MSMRRCACLVVAVLFLAGIAPAFAQQDASGPAAAWADFNHYVLIAQPALAKSSGTVLLNLDAQQLLDIVEASDYRATSANTLERAQKMAEVKDVAAQLAQRIQDARISRSRDPKRIADDIAKLGATDRERLNATDRLKAAGQFAAPLLLKTLNDDKQDKLHARVLVAAEQIGQPLVAPLAVALPSLEPRPMAQVAQLLADIGYPRSLPYLKQALESEKTDPTAREAVKKAFERIAKESKIPADMSSAALFLSLGQNFYTAQTKGKELPGYDASTKKGVVWEYRPELGLVGVMVPGDIFGDVLAMRAAERALKLNPASDAALNLWLLANVRRAQHLGNDGDPSYPSRLQPPSFYLLASGPARQHAVLAKALDDNDANLAIAAIGALADTAATDALVNTQGAAASLIRALYFPDRRVRIRAALVLAAARPTQAFAGSDRVVPVLAEAIRPGDAKYAMVLAKTQEDANALAATVKESEFTPVAGLSLQQVTTQIQNAPGIDVIVIKSDAESTKALVAMIRSDYRLAGAPILALPLTGETRVPDKDLPATFIGADDAATLKPALAAAVAKSAGAAIGQEEANAFTLGSIRSLRDIALCPGVYKIADAQPALIRALADNRADVVAQTADVLALLNSADAQKALADAALDANRAPEQRVMLLGNLARSATLMGNHLGDVQLEKVLTLAKSSQGELAVAAAKAHGALSLPTSNVVQLISGN